MALLKGTKTLVTTLALSSMMLTGCSENNATPVDEQNNMLTAAEKADGWTLLFDGKSVDHWKRFKQDGVPAAWSAVDGVLAFTPLQAKDDRGDIITKDTYSDFELKLEWKISKNGNSGILFYVVESDKYEKVYHTGPEMQVLDNDGHRDGKIISHRAGDLYDLIISKEETVKPVGQWNAVKIVSKNGHLEQWLNGVKVVETTMWDDNWRKMIAESKFNGWEDFGTFKEGHISLQDHGDKVWYRNLKIRKLK